MTGDVIMTLEEVVDAVSVPALVIQKDETGEYVNVILERKLITIEKRYIKTGTIGNNGLVEVIEGLKVGDEVLVNQQDD
jgi:multidrug efflux pump subunit AcrA (membrane-fusion protein)